MAIYHLTAKTGSRSGGQSAAAKAAYIQREGRYGKQPDALVHAHSGHMPEWAATAADYWTAADTYERANGRLFKEVEFSLPRELGTDAQRAVATGFAQALTGAEQLPYTLAIHEGKGSNPHCHLMINERANDGIARTPARWFKRANKQQPARGGAAKSAALKPKNWLTDTREAWQAHANRALARSGHDARIDHRSLEAQREAAQQRGDDRRAEALDREPGIHVGHAAQRMEAAGVASDRGREQRERAERNERRRGLYQQARELGETIRELAGRARETTERSWERVRDSPSALVQAWDRARDRLAAQYRVRAAAVGERIRRQLDELRGQRSEALAGMPAQPTPPRGVLARFQEARYQQAMKQWRQQRAAIQDWRQGREATLDNRLGRVDRCKREAPEKAERSLVRAWPAEAEQVADAREQVATAQDRAQTAKRFGRMAEQRERRAVGFTDRSDAWRHMNPTLKSRIEQYNSLSAEKRQKMLQAMSRDPKAAQAFKQLMANHERAREQEAER